MLILAHGSSGYWDEVPTVVPIVAVVLTILCGLLLAILRSRSDLALDHDESDSDHAERNCG